MKKVAKILLLIFVCVIMSGCALKDKKDMEKLAALAEEQFMQNQYDGLIRKLRAISGLSDLTGTPHFNYSEERDYDKRTKELRVFCNVSLRSDEIDEYFTRDYNSEKAAELRNLLSRLLKVFDDEEYRTYESDDGTVYLWTLARSSDEIYVLTSKDRAYSYNCMTSYDSVQIDNDIVYLADERGGNSSSSYTGSYDATLQYGTGAIAAFNTEESMERFTSAMVNDQQGTVDDMIVNGDVIYIEKNTKCNIVSKKTTKAQVILLDGAYEGDTVWVAIEAIKEH